MRAEYNGVSTLEKVIYLKNIHLRVSVFHFLPWRISSFVKVDKNGIFYTWKCYLTEWYTPLRKLTKTFFFTLENVFYPKNIRLCSIIHLCDFFTWSIYTSVWWYKFVIFFHLKYINLCDFLPELYTPNSDYKPPIFTWSIYTPAQLYTSVIFFLKYRHLYTIL